MSGNLGNKYLKGINVMSRNIKSRRIQVKKLKKTLKKTKEPYKLRGTVRERWDLKGARRGWNLMLLWLEWESQSMRYPWPEGNTKERLLLEEAREGWEWWHLCRLHLPMMTSFKKRETDRESWLIYTRQLLSSYLQCMVSPFGDLWVSLKLQHVLMFVMLCT